MQPAGDTALLEKRRGTGRLAFVVHTPGRTAPSRVIDDHQVRRTSKSLDRATGQPRGAADNRVGLECVSYDLVEQDPADPRGKDDPSLTRVRSLRAQACLDTGSDLLGEGVELFSKEFFGIGLQYGLADRSGRAASPRQVHLEANSTTTPHVVDDLTSRPSDVHPLIESYPSGADLGMLMQLSRSIHEPGKVRQGLACRQSSDNGLGLRRARTPLRGALFTEPTLEILGPGIGDES
jgi:hypothetical protein